MSPTLARRRRRREKALQCDACHGDKGRIDWKALGYAGDPRKK